MAITLQDALQRAIEHREIFHDEMLSLMRRIMSGEVSPVMIAALTVGLRVKKETIGEIAAAAQVMREFATRVDVDDAQGLLDIVGTGGDASHTFNISTASMFVAAAAGARVAKHGNRSVSSKSGSADVLEALGANMKPTPVSAMQVAIAPGFSIMLAPSASSTSALPDFDDTDRLPCFATRAPAAAATNIEAVEMLNVCAASPPVPTMSTRCSRSGTSTLVANSRIT